MRYALALLLVSAVPVLAHEAPTGWRYGYECCSTMDCRAVPTSAIQITDQGFVIKATGELIPYGDRKIKQSKDQDFHWCSRGGRDTSETICLYIPPFGF